MSLLSIVIFTHNRRELFIRALNSALKNKPDNVEIIVNNDAEPYNLDIPAQVKVLYIKAPLNLLPEQVIEQASGEYIYVLEDDDYLAKHFYSILDKLNDYDLITGGYLDGTSVNMRQPKIIFDLDRVNFQFGQMIFKRELFHFNAALYNRPCGETCVTYDYAWYQNMLSRTKRVLNTKTTFFIQSHDGQDNISYPEFTDLYKCRECPYGVYLCASSR